MTIRIRTPLRIARETMRERARNVDDRKRWSGRAVADACGIDQSQLSRLETLQAKCTPPMAERIAALFPPYLLTELHLLYPERYMQDGTPRTPVALDAKPKKAPQAEATPAGLTVDEFCARFRIRKWTFYRMRRDGTAPPFMRVGGRILILKEGLPAWKRAHMQPTAPQSNAPAAA